MDEGVGITVYINVKSVIQIHATYAIAPERHGSSQVWMGALSIPGERQAHTTMKSGPYSLPTCAKQDCHQTRPQEICTASHDTYRYLLLNFLHMIPSYSFLMTNSS
jgi:hypothetical protein